MIPTYRRPALLRRCLDAVLAQGLAPEDYAVLAQGLAPEDYEVIVVDDGHDDATRDLVASMAEAARPGPALRYLRPAQGRGPAVARNAGWRSAAAPLVAFTDDDTIPDADWLAHGEEAMRRHPDWSALCGRVVVPRTRRGRPTDHELMTQGLETAQFVTANAFVRRDALEAVQGFDERFTRAWREDSDLQFRLMQNVGPVGRWAKAGVAHPVRAEAWGLCLRQQRNAFFDALLYKKHPRLYRERIRPVPPWDYYLIVVLTLAAPLLAWGGARGAAAGALAAALALVLRFALRRLRHTSLAPGHVVEMLATSALIPFLSVYWRLRGALRFRVVFL